MTGWAQVYVGQRRFACGKLLSFNMTIILLQSNPKSAGDHTFNSEMLWICYILCSGVSLPAEKPNGACCQRYDSARHNAVAAI